MRGGEQVTAVLSSSAVIRSDDLVGEDSNFASSSGPKSTVKLLIVAVSILRSSSSAILVSR